MSGTWMKGEEYGPLAASSRSYAARQFSPFLRHAPCWLKWLAIFTLYGSLFTGLRTFAALWGTYELFSLWFPAAGLRFAFLWRLGPKVAPAAALAEFAVGLATRTVSLSDNALLSTVGIMGPCYAYALVIAIVRARGERTGNDADGALPFASACIIAPFIACVAALPWALPAAMSDGVLDGSELTSGLLVFSLGDLLGVLLVAPPLLWIAYHRRPEAMLRALRGFRPGLWIEHLLVLTAAWGMVLLIYHFGNGLVLAPIVLATCWIGMRGGRAVAWLATVLTAIIVFPFTAEMTNPQARIELHLVIACIAAGGYLAGSFSESERRAGLEISRRNRLLFHADRLKTVRAMSLAVIHEISQPLTTIALEARAMNRASGARPLSADDLHSMSELIARKADDLSEMIGRLRKFGSAVSDEPVLVTAGCLVRDALAMVAEEAARVGATIALQTDGDAWLSVGEVELKQALLNMLRNAIAVAPRSDTAIRAGWTHDRTHATLFVENEVNSSHQPAGMGIGLLIVRSIVQAYGGRLAIERPSPNLYRSSIHLPLARRPV